MKKQKFFKQLICLLMVCAMLCGISVTAMAAEVPVEKTPEVETAEARSWVIDAYGDARYQVSQTVNIPAGNYTFYYSVTTPGTFYFNYGDGYSMKPYSLSGSGEKSVYFPRRVIEWIFVPNNTSTTYSYSFVM